MVRWHVDDLMISHLNQDKIIKVVKEIKNIYGENLTENAGSGSDFWDPHRKRNSDSVFDSEDSGLIFFLRIPLLKNREIRILIAKFGIQKKKLRI